MVPDNPRHPQLPQEHVENTRDEYEVLAYLGCPYDPFRFEPNRAANMCPQTWDLHPHLTNSTSYVTQADTPSGFYDSPKLEQRPWSDLTPVDLRFTGSVSTSTVAVSPSLAKHFELSISERTGPNNTSTDTIPVDKPIGPGRNLEIRPKMPRESIKIPQQKVGQVSESCKKERKPSGLSKRRDVLMDTAPKVVLWTDRMGNVVGTEHVFGLEQRVRNTLSDEMQLATARARKIGACLRCRRNKIRCYIPTDLYQPCEECRKLVVNIFGQPCIRIDILTISLHRKGSTLDQNLQIWANRTRRPQEFRIDLTQDLGRRLPVKVSLFVKKRGDKTAYIWEDPSGVKKSLEMPPYIISDMYEALLGIQEYCHQSREHYIDSLLKGANPIIRKTFRVALNHVVFAQDSLVSYALSIWMATRLTERPWRICNGENLMHLTNWRESGDPWEGIIPVTPIIDTQLDHLVILGQLNPLTERFLKKLKRKIEERKRENWFELYLAMFVMMSNFEWILKDVVEYSNRHGMKSGNRGGTSLTEGYIHACKTMLAYFHFACNGSVPFSLSWPRPNDESQHMTNHQVEFLRTIQIEISRQGSGLESWRTVSMYGTEMYWCSQLLCNDWSGSIEHTGRIDEFTEEDFLTS